MAWRTRLSRGTTSFAWIAFEQSRLAPVNRFQAHERRVCLGKMDELPSKEGGADPNDADVEERIALLEAKVEELEKAIWDLIQNSQKNLEMMASIHGTFQNLNSYLVVNVGPPLFLE